MTYYTSHHNQQKLNDYDKYIYKGVAKVLVSTLPVRSKNQVSYCNDVNVRFRTLNLKTFDDYNERLLGFRSSRILIDHNGRLQKI